MKSLKKIALTTLVLSTLSSASDDIAQKITSFYNTVTNGAVIFDAKKSGDGYDLKITPKNPAYKEIFNNEANIHISVDKGLFSTKLKSEGEVFSIFNKEAQDALKKDLKSSPKYKYEGKVGFSGNLKEEIKIEPLKVVDKDMDVDSSEIVIKTDINLDKQIGKLKLYYDHFALIPKNEEGIFKISGIEIDNEITEPPVNGFVLFSNNKISIKDVEFLATKPTRQHAKFSLTFDSYIKRVDEKLLDLYIASNAKTDDVDTIALAKGIKEAKTEWLFKNLGIDGVVEFLKLAKEMEEAQNELALATQGKKGDEAFAKYMATIDELNNKLVPVFNKTFIKDKTKLIANIELKSNKTSYVKVDLTYKGEPISGNANVAFISLAAQGLAIADGDVDIKIDKDLANSINPFAIMILDMLKNKGMAKEQNGIYEFKATLKGGNIIVNGKSYTLQEFSRALF